MYLKNSFLKEGDSSYAKDFGLSESRLDPAIKGWDCGEVRFSLIKSVLCFFPQLLRKTLWQALKHPEDFVEVFPTT